MKCDTSTINLPTKQLKHVMVGEVFSMSSPTALPYVRIIPNTGEQGFTVLSLGTNEFYTPQEEDMDKQVTMLDATVIIKMIEREKK